MFEGDSRIRARLTVAIVGVAFVGIVIALLASGGGSPEDYLSENYDHVSGDDPDTTNGVVFASNDGATQTANAISAGTDSDERREENGTHYLRYDSDWMVTVEDEPSGSEVSLYEFDRGYAQHMGVVGFWGGFYNRDSGGGFRGGGSGFGK